MDLMDPRETAARGACEAAATGDMHLLRQWIAVAPSVRTLEAALCGAAAGGAVEMATWLLACGVTPTATYEGKSAVEWAGESGRERFASLLRVDEQTQGPEPSWFRPALGVPRREGAARQDGGTLHWVEWGRRGLPVMVFLHGFTGHAEWWSFIAPFFADTHHCLALDLSGHGDSDWKATYSREAWSEEIDVVLAAAGAETEPLLVGHSMGGLIALATAARRSETLKGIVVVDSPMRPPEPPPGWTELVPEREVQRGKHRVYGDFEEAVSRFRLVPPQPVSNATLHRHVAESSLRRVEGGWTWKFDPAMFGRRELTPTGFYLENATCPIAVIVAERSLVVDPSTPEYTSLFEDRGVPRIDIPAAHHHLLIDQPIALVATLRALLQTWARP